MFWRNFKDCCELAEASLDGDFGWFWEIATILVVVLFFNIAVKRLLMFLHGRFKAHGRIWEESFVSALYQPLSYYVWFFALIEIVDFFTIQTFSSSLFSNKSQILGIAGILSLAWFLMRWKNNAVKCLHTKNKIQKMIIDPTRIDVIEKIITVVIMFITAFLLLDITGSSLNTLIAFGGVSGLALAFAAQEVIGSFFGGLMVYITQPFVLGDWVVLPEKDIEGYVEEIGWYNTKVRTFDKRPIYVPNSIFSKIVVINPSRMTHRRIKEVIGLRYSDINELKPVIADILQMLKDNNDIEQNMTISVHFLAFGAYSLDIQISAYTLVTTNEGFNQVKEQVLFNIIDIIDKRKVGLAFPTTSIEIPALEKLNTEGLEIKRYKEKNQSLVNNLFS